MKLSVIVPVYNVEKFLPRCLDSLLRQGMEPGEWEVICVNDGSPDNCGAILAEYEKKHPDIFKVITQENQGLGIARNVGTVLAQGEFVTYLDSDDYLVDGGYRYLLDNFCGKRDKVDKIDVMHYNFCEIYTDGKTVCDPDAKPDGVITFDGDGVDAYNRFPLLCVWTKFYRRVFLIEHEIWSENVVSQDALFNFDVFSYHPHLLMVSSSVVFYERANENSAQTTTNKDRILVQLYEYLDNIGRINKYLEDGKTDLVPAARRVISLFWSHFHRKMKLVVLSYTEWKGLYKKRKTLPPYNPDLSCYNRGTRWLMNAQKKAGTSWAFYYFFTFIRNNFFVPYIRPLIVNEETEVK